MTPEEPAPERPRAASWKALREDLKNANADRHPFYPIGQLDRTVRLTLLGAPIFDPSGFHGQFSTIEIDVADHTGTPYRLCVSGSRLAAALAAIEPAVGDTVEITPIGTGRERKWQARKIEAVAPIAA